MTFIKGQLRGQVGKGVSIQLNEARKQLKERCVAIAEKYKPAGYTTQLKRRRLTGRCEYPRAGKPGVIYGPAPATRKSLYVILHEYAHAHLDHGNSKKPVHEAEVEAEQWAKKVLREEGIAVPREMVREGKKYVAEKIAKAERRGASKISSVAKRYANS